MALIENKKANFNYEILEKFQAGIELFGYEVKSIKNHRGSLEGAHVIMRGNEAYLVGSNIPAFQPKNAPKDYDPLRTRRLLLTKKEIKELTGKERIKGLTLVPISMYNKARIIKVEIGIGRGKKKFDKRQVITKRETERSIRRTLKNE